MDKQEVFRKALELEEIARSNGVCLNYFYSHRMGKRLRCDRPYHHEGKCSENGVE